MVRALTMLTCLSNSPLSTDGADEADTLLSPCCRPGNGAYAANRRASTGAALGPARRNGGSPARRLGPGHRTGALVPRSTEAAAGVRRPGLQVRSPAARRGDARTGGPGSPPGWLAGPEAQRQQAPGGAVTLAVGVLGSFWSPCRCIGTRRWAAQVGARGRGPGSALPARRQPRPSATFPGRGALGCRLHFPGKFRYFLKNWGRRVILTSRGRSRSVCFLYPARIFDQSFKIGSLKSLRGRKLLLSHVLFILEEKKSVVFNSEVC